MVRNDGELVQDQRVGGIVLRKLGEQKIRRWVFEGVRLRGLCSVGFGGSSRFPGQRWAVTELELD